MPKITVDDIEYNTEDLSDNGKQLPRSIFKSNTKTANGTVTNIKFIFWH